MDTLALLPGERPRLAAGPSDCRTPLPHRVLIVGENERRRAQLRNALAGDAAFLAETAAANRRPLEQLSQNRYSLVVLCLRTAGRDGAELAREIHRLRLPVTVLAVGANEWPDGEGWDHLDEPVELDQLREAVRAALHDRELRERVRQLKADLRARYGFDNVLSDDPRMHRLFETIRHLGCSDATVLIEGETGTGKEEVARAVHAVSSRSAGPLIAVNCAALPEGVLGSELFGHEKGSFTNAVGQRQGRFELADGGTLFLDEVADIPLTMQAKLLRVLQEHQFERVGGVETITVDLRVIGATNRPLPRLVRRKRFREDLYYRLNVVKLVLPPLRERPDDVPLLAAHFVEKYAVESRPCKRVSPRTLEVLRNCSWPGNVRQLENAVQRACATAPGNEILPDHLPSELVAPTAPELPTRVNLDRPLPQLVHEMVAALEVQYMRKALQKTQGNVSRCAQLCGLSRRSMRAKMVEYGLDKTHFKSS